MLRSQRKPILPPPPADKEYVVIILPEQCDGCELCVEFCPTDVLEIDMEAYNSRMLHPAIAVKPDECVGCQQCERICPSVSIFVTEIQLLQEESS
ncbi:MAG: 4Fe-4S binding protein [Candidatus Heimdallarchaeota archaeon]|nr:MAG: 4Fe-4S binding protein [Candidatus Heimdallarchaeota archaeon]